MESAVEELGIENLQSKEIETLQPRIDGLQMAFDDLYQRAEVEGLDKQENLNQTPDAKNFLQVLIYRGKLIQPLNMK